MHRVKLAPGERTGPYKTAILPQRKMRTLRKPLAREKAARHSGPYNSPVPYSSSPCRRGDRGGGESVPDPESIFKLELAFPQLQFQVQQSHKIFNPKICPQGWAPWNCHPVEHLVRCWSLPISAYQMLGKLHQRVE